MNKIQVFYDEDTKEEAIKIAAFRLGMPVTELVAAWKDREIFIKGIGKYPLMLLQPIEVVFEEETEEEETETYFDEVFDGNELWFPFGWDTVAISAFIMSNVFEITGCNALLNIYFYC